MSSPPHRQSLLQLRWDSPSALKMVRPVCSPVGEGSQVHLFTLRNLFEEASCLKHLWESKALCDVVLKSKDGGCVWAHRIVLASVSSFFRAMFTGTGRSMREVEERLPTGEQCIELRGVTGDALEMVLWAIYARELELSPENLELLLSCSNLLEISPVQEACCQYLRRCMGLHNCLEILELSERYSCEELKAEVLQYVCGKFSEIFSKPDWAISNRSLSKSVLLEILGSDDVDVESEFQVLEVALAWVKADPHERREDIPDIVSVIRLPESIILHQLQSNGFLTSYHPVSVPLDPNFQGGQDAEYIDKNKSHLDVTSNISTSNTTPRVRTGTGILIAGGHDAEWRSLKLVEVYNPHRDEWTPGPSMPCSFSFTGAAAVRNSVLVVGGTMYTGNVCKFDGRQCRWTNCPPLNTARVHSGITSSAGVFYVLGGRTGVGQPLCSVETYECMGNTEPISWANGPDLCQPRSALGAGACGTHVYAVGGQAGRTVYDTVECLDAHRGQWSLLQAHLGMKRKYVAVGSAGNRLFAVGGMNEHRIRLSTVEAYDPREGKWQMVGSMHVARSSCGMTTLHGRLYVVGGNAGDDVIHDTVECFLPETNQWVPCASISCGRSGLSAVPI